MQFEVNKILIKGIILFFVSFLGFFYLFSLFLNQYYIDDTDYIEYTKQNAEKIELQSSFEEKENIIDDKIQQRKNEALARYKEHIEKQKQLIDNYDTNEIIKYELNPEGFFVDEKGKTIVSVLSNIIKSKIFLNDFESLVISLYEKSFEVRGKYKNKNILLFDLDRLLIEEISSVFIHEYGHFFDLVLLSPKYRQNFYDLSWESSKVLKAGVKNTSFVSGYAMTNKYEDFAESYVYFVMHNASFEKKASKDIILQKKYDFFTKYVFKNKEFEKTLFAKDEKLQDYYWDITKININLQKFLEYLKKGI